MSKRRERKQKAARPLPIGGGGGWFPVSSFAWSPEAWQADSPKPVESILRNNAFFACVTLIASDIGKLRPKLVELSADGIWTETTSPAFSPVLRKPNRFQNHIQFKECWTTSKLLHGNTVALKERDARGVVVALYILNWLCVTPLVAPDGAVYYELREDNLAGIDAASIVVPASEVIHDRMNCLFHPLVGIPPIYASGATAEQGLRMQNDSSRFFANSSSPGGVLTAPGTISDDNAKRMKDHWEKNYSGTNAGRVAVLGDGLKFERMRMTAVESQLTEQLDLSAQVICSTFHVPAFMIGLGKEPTYGNGETRAGLYYSQCLQTHIEHMEESLDDGLGLLGSPKDGRTLGVELDLTGLLRMDAKTQIEALAAAVGGSVMKTNEARKVMNLPPVDGGDTIYMQQQNYSLEALNDRPAPDTAAPAPAAADPADPPADPAADAAKAVEEVALRVLDASHAKTADAQNAQKAEASEQLRTFGEHILTAIAEKLAGDREAARAELESVRRAAEDAAQRQADALAVALAQLAELQKQADARQQLEAEARDAQALVDDEQRRQAEAFEASKAMAEALMRKFSGVRDAA